MAASRSSTRDGWEHQHPNGNEATHLSARQVGGKKSPGPGSRLPAEVDGEPTPLNAVAVTGGRLVVRAAVAVGTAGGGVARVRLVRLIGVTMKLSVFQAVV